MPEIAVRIPVEAGKITLEGLFQESKTGRIAVLCHPHPLYGGDMQNNVVVAARSAFAGRGWGTLRFNFRGVGESGGTAGQSEKEALDLVAVKEYLEKNHPGALDFAGYSYGAWIVMKALGLGLESGSLCLMSPPLDFLSFEGLELPDLPTLITLGERDDFCKKDSLAEWLAARHAGERVSLETFPSCDHFYRGFETRLASILGDFLAKNFPG